MTPTSLSPSSSTPPPLIVGDPGRLEQVVSNLIDNALKYNKPGGSIQLYAGGECINTLPQTDNPRPLAAASPLPLSASRDSGVGIPTSKQPRLFERFFRADAARVAGGSGLGLSIVQEIVRQHHGEITFESIEGTGTTFQVWLPAV